MFDSINTLFLGLLTFIGGSGAWIFFRDSRKKSENAKADQEVAEAKLKEAEAKLKEAEAKIKEAEARKAEADNVANYATQWEKLYERSDAEVKELNTKIDDLYQQITELRKDLWDALANLQVAEGHVKSLEPAQCYRYDCKHRAHTVQVVADEVAAASFAEFNKHITTNKEENKK